ncbi:uncharacterized protein EV154DRAFT_574902 [Mucor mucedo]|uniref:uncharacterized protein n=1 Tax=Mucor mucedo TaxID=29922 RepID=UPI00222047BC|nr:uncharacterized protein EV154DRAFT_574902 [Mucor mucedo]KAI7883392.1 hypothetical protein EV154DRAFT_574902 [Mucor mucedo]
MKHLSLIILTLYLTAIEHFIAQSAGSGHDAACEYLANRIYCFGGSSWITKSVTRTGIAMLDILRYSGNTTDVLNKNWVYITTNNEDLVSTPRGLPQHMRLPDEDIMIINGGFSHSIVNKKLTYQTIAFNANDHTWSSLPNFTQSGYDRQIYSASSFYVPGQGVGFYGGAEDSYEKGWTYPDINMTDYIDTSDTLTIGFTKLTFFNLSKSMNNPWSEYPLEKNRLAYFSTSQVSIYDIINNRILLLGGTYQNPAKKYHYQVFSSSPSFNLANGEWTTQNFTGAAIPEVRIRHTATVVGSDQNHVLLYGGRNSSDGWAVSDYCYTLDLTNNKWMLQDIQPGYNVILRRSSHSALLVDKSTVFIVYGVNEDGVPANSTLILNVSNPSVVLAINSYEHPKADDVLSFPTPTIKNSSDDTNYSDYPTTFPIDDTPSHDEATASNPKSGNTILWPEYQSNIYKTIGIAVGSTVGCLAIIGALVFYLCIKKRSEKHQREIEEFERRRCEIEALHKTVHIEEEPMIVNWDEIDKEFIITPIKPYGCHNNPGDITNGTINCGPSNPPLKIQEIKRQLPDDISHYDHNLSTRLGEPANQDNQVTAIRLPDAINEDVYNLKDVQLIQKPDGF